MMQCSGPHDNFEIYIYLFLFVRFTYDPSGYTGIQTIYTGMKAPDICQL